MTQPAQTAVVTGVPTPDVYGLTASSLYGRTYAITVGTLDVSTLRCVFNVKKTSKAGEPNTCDLKIYNLNSGNRCYLQSIVGTGADGTGTAGIVPCSIQAGYLGPGNSQIYLGQVRTANSTTEGPDIVTELSTGDSEKEISRNRLNTSFAKGTPPGAALNAVLAALGIGQGNAAQAIALMGGSAVFSRKGLSGKASDHLTRLCQAAGLEWSVQDGAVQILKLGAAVVGTPVLLSSTSGMIGSPTIDNQGIVTVRALMIPGIAPGSLVTINGENLQGTFKVTQAEYTGDTGFDADEWYIDITGKKYP